MNPQLTVKNGVRSTEYAPVNSPIRSSQPRDSFGSSAPGMASEPARPFARPSARYKDAFIPRRLSSSSFHILYLLLRSLLRIARSSRGVPGSTGLVSARGSTERYDAASEKSASARTSAPIRSTAWRRFLVDHAAVRLPPTTTTRTACQALQVGGDLFMCWPRCRINPTPSSSLGTHPSHLPTSRPWSITPRHYADWPPRRCLFSGRSPLPADFVGEGFRLGAYCAGIRPVEKSAVCLAPDPLEGGAALSLEQTQESH
jgi:hypothetical protein